jgi:nucleotide-binding universal stress UspA family protein
VFATIVVGIDGSDTARAAVDAAVELAALSGAALELVCAYEPARRDDVEGTLADAAGRAHAAGVGVQEHPREGDAADAILDVAEELGADLIVVGNKGTTGAKRFLLGSVPNKVSHYAPCAVMIVRTG